MKIYGLDVSNPTNKVRYVANALGLKYEFEPIMPFSEQIKSDEYRSLHPAGKVPVIVDDDGFVLFESNAIIKYLAQKNNSALYPQDLKERVKVDQWIDFVSIHIRAALARVFWNRVGVKFMNEQPDQNSLNDGLKFLDRFLPIIENQLSKENYLAGEQLTLADFNLLAELDGVEACEVNLSKYKKLTTWRQDLQAQDFYQVDRSQGEAILAEISAQK